MGYWNRQAQEPPTNQGGEVTTNRTITRIDRWEPTRQLVRQVLEDIGVTGLMVDLWLVSDVLSLTAKFMREPSGARRRLTSAAAGPAHRAVRHTIRKQP